MNRLRILALAAALLSAGCIQYVETDIGQVRPSQKVRLRVTEAQLGRLAAFADGAEGTVNGEVMGVAADSVRVLVQSPVAFQEVAIPRDAILGTTLRRPDNKKNFIISASAVGIVGYLAWKGFSGGGSRGPGSDSGGADESLIPLFSFGIPFGR